MVLLPRNHNCVCVMYPFLAHFRIFMSWITNFLLGAGALKLCCLAVVSAAGQMGGSVTVRAALAPGFVGGMCRWRCLMGWAVPEENVLDCVCCP